MHTNYTRENSDVSDTGDFFYFNLFGGLNVSSSGGFRGGSLEPLRSPPPTVFKYPIKMK